VGKHESECLSFEPSAAGDGFGGRFRGEWAGHPAPVSPDRCRLIAPSTAGSARPCGGNFTKTKWRRGPLFFFFQSHFIGRTPPRREGIGRGLRSSAGGISGWSRRVSGGLSSRRIGRISVYLRSMVVHLLKLSPGTWQKIRTPASNAVPAKY